MSKQLKLRPKQKAFADKYLETGNATKAVIESGYKTANNAVARSIGSENLTKPNILTYLSAHDQTAQNTIVEVMINSSEKKDEPQHARIAIDSAKQVLDRLHGTPVAKQEVSITSVNLNLDLTNITSTPE